VIRYTQILKNQQYPLHQVLIQSNTYGAPNLLFNDWRGFVLFTAINYNNLTHSNYLGCMSTNQIVIAHSISKK
jgi:hypothetical protein